MLIALGPCLILGMASVALYVVHCVFSRSHHALLWAGGCALGMLQWGTMAGKGMAGAPPLYGGPTVDLFGLGAVLLLTQGFRARASGQRSPLVLIVLAATTLGALLLTVALPPMPLRAAVTPALSGGLLVWMALLVGTPGERASPTERSVVATLVAVALIQGGAALLAMGEQVGLVGSHRPFVMLVIVTTAPASAAIALVTLMLIAFDFSVELRRLVHTDPLTGISNRAGFEHAAHFLLDRTRSKPLAVAVADIDRFKQVNDVHGHLAGDAMLASVAAHLTMRLGRDATVARMGGEEFALLLPELDCAAAVRRIEPVRESLTAVRIAGVPGLAITASFGIAEHVPGETLADLLERADIALYRSKREGRNRTTCAPAHAGPAWP